MNLIEKLKPIYPDDENEWQEVTSEIDGPLPPIFWYGGAAFDSDPLLSLYGGFFPGEVENSLSESIFPVLTDYSSEIARSLKKIYGTFDNEGFDPQGAAAGEWFSGRLDEVDFLQMIPPTLFSLEELARIRKRHPDFHRSATGSVVPDDRWHFVYIVAETFGKQCALLYGLIENRTFWHEIVEKYALEVEAFCALSVGGKSGGWDRTHDPERGKLFDAIQKSESSKPKIWIADECEKLRKIWREIEPHERGFLGEMHFFETDWSRSPG